jgi:hypothetical protein
MSFAESLKKVAEDKQKKYCSNREEDIRRAVNKFKKLAAAAAEKGEFEKTVSFVYLNTKSERDRAFDIIHRCISILEKDLGFTVEQWAPREITSYDRNLYQVLITLYW